MDMNLATEPDAHGGDPGPGMPVEAAEIPAQSVPDAPARISSPGRGKVRLLSLRDLDRRTHAYQRTVKLKIGRAHV